MSTTEDRVSILEDAVKSIRDQMAIQGASISELSTQSKSLDKKVEDLKTLFETSFEKVLVQIAAMQVNAPPLPGSTINVPIKPGSPINVPTQSTSSASVTGATDETPFHQSEIYRAIAGSSVGGALNGNWRKDSPIFANCHGEIVHIAKDCAHFLTDGEETLTNIPERDKIQTPQHLKSLFPSPTELLEFARKIVFYINQGGNKLPGTWKSDDSSNWPRIAKSLMVDEKDVGWVSLREWVLIILYHCFKPLKVKDYGSALSKEKLGFFPDRIILNYNVWRSGKKDILDKIPFNPMIISEMLQHTIDDRYVVLKSKMAIADFSSWDSVFEFMDAEIKELSDAFAKGYTIPGVQPSKDKAPQRKIVNAVVDARDKPKLGWVCPICSKKFADKDTKDLAKDEMNHAYPYRFDGSGECKCPDAKKFPEKAEAQLERVLKQYKSRQAEKAGGKPAAKGAKPGKVQFAPEET